jgi:tripartite motif-containing protein 71
VHYCGPALLFPMNLKPVLRPVVAVLLPLLLGARPPRQASYPDQERRPNWVRATYGFGSCGTEPGQLMEPSAVAVGRENTLFVADSGNHRIQTFTLDGTRTGGWGRAGSGDGEFLFPAGVAVSDEGEVYVADTGNNRIQVFDAGGAFLRSWGRPGVGSGEFSAPRTVAARRGRVYVVESDHPRLQVFGAKGEWVRSIGGWGDAAGRLKDPAGVAVDDDGRIYVADSGNSRIQVFDPEGTPIREWGTWGSHEGMLAWPAGLAWSAGKLYLADSANHRVQVFDRDGGFLYQWGKAPAFAHEGNGRLHFPAGIAVSPNGGHTVLCEPGEHRVQVFANGGARSPKPANDLPWWDSLHARFHTSAPPPPKDRPAPRLVPLLEADTHSVLFYDIAPKFPAFVARAGGFGKRMGEFDGPAGVVLEPSPLRTFVSERGNRRIQRMELRKDPSSPSGFASAARMVAAWDLPALLSPPPPGFRIERCRPGALASDGRGGLLVVDEGNSVVLAFDADLNLVRVLRPPDSLKGPSRFVDVAVGAGTIRVLDRYAACVHTYDPEGRWKSSWGSRSPSGDDGFLSPAGIAIDADGNVYVSDSLLHQVRKIDPAGKLLKRWGARGREVAEFWSPQALIWLAPNRLIVDDVGNHRAGIYAPDGQLVELLYKGGFLPPPPPPK